MPSVANSKKHLFEFFERRVERAVLKDLSCTDKRFLTPEQEILIITGIEALSNIWIFNINKDDFRKDANGQDRWTEFLSRHGGHPAFKRIAEYTLRQHEAKEPKPRNHFKSQNIEENTQ